MKTKENQLGQVSLRSIRSIVVNRAQTKHSARNRMLANSHAGMARRLPPSWKLARPLNTIAFVGTYLVRLPATGLLDSRMPHVAGRVH
jgi:hypothetical protein